MRKAEERALEAYPVIPLVGYYDLRDKKPTDGNKLHRKIFLQGYEAAQKDLSWISVKERLPEKSGMYFTNTEYVEIGIHCYHQYYGWFDSEGYSVVVDYWMPIPELPKK